MAATVDGVTVGDVPADVASRNTLAINAAVLARPENVLPPGLVRVNPAPTIRPGTRLYGDADQGTEIQNVQAYPALAGFAPGFGYTSPYDLNASLYPIKTGEYWYAFVFGDWNATPRSRIVTVVAVTPDGKYETKPPLKPNEAVTRFKRLWPAEPAAEGADRVRLRVPSDGITEGMYLWFTNGPCADAADGCYRRVVRVERMEGPTGATALHLDKPLSLALGSTAGVADTAPLAGCTFDSLRVSAAPNGNLVPWVASFKGCVDLRLHALEPTGALDVISCTDVSLSGLRGGPVQFNTASGVEMTGCHSSNVYAEEACMDVTLRSCLLGRNRPDPANVVTVWFRVRRFTFDGVTVVGAGREQWPPPAAFMVFGDDMAFRFIVCKENRGAWTIIGGKNLSVLDWKTDGGWEVHGSQCVNASLNHVRGPYQQILSADPKLLNRMMDVENYNEALATGWTATGCTKWVPPGAAPEATGLRALAARVRGRARAAVPEPSYANYERPLMFHPGERSRNALAGALRVSDFPRQSWMPKRAEEKA